MFYNSYFDLLDILSLIISSHVNHVTIRRDLRGLPQVAHIPYEQPRGIPQSRGLPGVPRLERRKPGDSPGYSSAIIIYPI